MEIALAIILILAVVAVALLARRSKSTPSSGRSANRPRRSEDR